MRKRGEKHPDPSQTKLVRASSHHASPSQPSPVGCLLVRYEKAHRTYNKGIITRFYIVFTKKNGSVGSKTNAASGSLGGDRLMVDRIKPPVREGGLKKVTLFFTPRRIKLKIK